MGSSVRQRHGSRRAALLAAAALASATTSCGLFSDDTAAATWTIAAHQDLNAQSTQFTVLVSRLGCNNGETGEVVEPDVTFEEDRVILTFEVTPGEPSSATCPSNNTVPYDVALREPLGDRALVDGECLKGEAKTTAFCTDDGVLYGA
ncbi:MAG: hypothetical protein JWR83_2820 [Aeromicrobium sp.]|nr:hypothetical protein [Aeromicrobium sp.]